LLEPGKQNNRLSSTTVGSIRPIIETYAHDSHGNMTAMPHLPLMQWNFKDQLSATSRQVVNNGAPETTYYVYDGTGQRMRKVTERQNGTRRNERIYLGGFEIYREYDANGNTLTLERETLHMMDDKQRVALVETRTAGNDGSPGQLIRYQFGNHLGSASLELDGAGQIISYEEYYPYGSTSYQAGRNMAEVSLKRYRYTGMERDEETGLSYHGARYHAPWFGRWTSVDPSGLDDGSNLYMYVRNNPLRFIDPNGTDAQGENIRDILLVAPSAAPVVAKTAPIWIPLVVPTLAALGAGAGIYGLLRLGNLLEGSPTTSNPPRTDLPPGEGCGSYCTVPLESTPVPQSAAPAPPPAPKAKQDPNRKSDPKPDPKPAPDPKPKPRTDDDDKRGRRRNLGRIYVTYVKIQDITGLIYVGRTDMVVDRDKPLYQQALLAIATRGFRHHKDDEGYGPSLLDENGIGPAALDVFVVGNAVNRDFRRLDEAYHAIRGREQQMIDAHGGAWSDTGKPYKTGNAIRGVARDNKLGRKYHKAATRKFGELHRYTGN
jgi:RHS repeat-associated protein